eukprot:3437036-Karenia_brevis.AAC.1
MVFSFIIGIANAEFHGSKRPHTAMRNLPIRATLRDLEAWATDLITRLETNHNSLNPDHDGKSSQSFIPKLSNLSTLRKMQVREEAMETWAFEGSSMSVLKLVEFRNYILLELFFDNLHRCWPSEDISTIPANKSK